MLRQHLGDVVLSSRTGVLEGFAVCLTGAGSEGGSRTSYVKFAASRGGAGAGARFERLLDACEAFAASRATTLEAGLNLAREDACRRVIARGYRVTTLGVAMQRPHADGHNRPGAYVIDDWR